MGREEGLCCWPSGCDRRLATRASLDQRREAVSLSWITWRGRAGWEGHLEFMVNSSTVLRKREREVGGLPGWNGSDSGCRSRAERTPSRPSRTLPLPLERDSFYALALSPPQASAFIHLFTSTAPPVRRAWDPHPLALPADPYPRQSCLAQGSSLAVVAQDCSTESRSARRVRVRPAAVELEESSRRVVVVLGAHRPARGLVVRLEQGLCGAEGGSARRWE